MNTTPRPLVPADIKPVNAIPHACWAAVAAAAAGNGYAGDLCAKMFPRDVLAHQLLTRAAVSGANTTTPAWAGVLAQRVVGDWLGSLVPASAAAALIARGVTVSLAGRGSIGVPVRAAPPTSAAWVSEQGVIPVRAWSLASVDLSPRKMPVITVLTKELARSSDALPIFEALLREDAAMSLDSAYFGADDGSTSGHHAGLLAGLTAGTGTDDMATDLSALAQAVGANGSGQVVFIAGPGRAAAAAVRMPAEATATVLPSLAVPEDRLIAIDPVVLVHGFADGPEIRASEEAVLVMRDDPTDVGVPGSPAIAGAPSTSLFQSSMIAMRMLLDIAFAARRSGAVAYADGCTW